jgi:exopolysaccharide production protein ExoQ
MRNRAVSNNRTAGTLQRNTTPAASARKQRGGWLLTLMGWVILVSNTVPFNVFDEARLGPLPEGAFGVNVPARIIKLTLLILSAAIVVRNWSAMVALAKQLNRFFVAFLVIVPLSILWSISPDDTIARFVTIISILIVWCAVCVASWEPRRFQHLLRPLLTLLILGSMVFAWTSPLAIEVGEGTLKDAWRGLAYQKNGFGTLASIAFIFWVHAWLARQANTWLAIFLASCSAYCVFMSRSSTALLSTLLVFAFLLMLMRAPTAFRRSMPYFVAAFATVVVTYAVIILRVVPGLDILLTPVMAITGKDMTFSNRAAIWDVIKQHISFSPVLGSGYGAYWIGAIPSSPSYEFLGRLYFYPNQAHNGYLEMMNDLGYVGLIILLGYLIWYLRQSLYLWRFDRNQAALYMAIFFQQAIMNLSESLWLDINAGFAFTLMTFATVALARSAAEPRAGVEPVLARAPLVRPATRPLARARR